MSLREQARQDARAILNDSVTGFGWPIKVTDPAGLVANLTGFGNDISQLIDPDTGAAISGRMPSVALHIDDVAAAYGAALPGAVADPTIKPWLVTFDDISGNTVIFKVAESFPDRALGLITCGLEFYG